MRILGQFNLGFIIAELRGDLYILDQHACDEKHRFEQLQATTQIHQQPLIAPLGVETSAALELTIADNLSVFEKNGFKLRVDEAGAGPRVKLLAVPFSKSISFGAEDVNELASMILDSGGGDAGDAILGFNGTGGPGTFRLPKLVALYASRACRSAVMIGTALRPAEMSRIVGRMAAVHQPWNCPHGRPTMRHLADVQAARGRKVAQLRNGQ
ncbi:hypothetical protein B484DRAFT_343451 [Ochromonadaceae sp. CCMP2298]|nr:hypothetical protein B484DRAFT_343451 [Ochromonadaceae sp. CCMP2298]